MSLSGCAKGVQCQEEDDFSVVSDPADDVSSVSENPTEVASRRLPLPWDKPMAPPMPTDLTKEKRKIYYAERKEERLAHDKNPAVIAYKHLFIQSSVCVENGLPEVAAYAEAQSTDPAYLPKHLCVLVYTHQALTIGSTTFTDDPTRSLLFLDKEKKALFRVAAGLSYAKLQAQGHYIEDYFAPKTVQSMRDYLNL